MVFSFAKEKGYDFMKRILICFVFILSLTGCKAEKKVEPKESVSESKKDEKDAEEESKKDEKDAEEESASADIPIDITIESFEDETDEVYKTYEHTQYSFEMPESWQIADGTERGLVNGVFLVPPDTAVDNFFYSAHVAIEAFDSMPEGEVAPDFSNEEIQKEFFASQIVQTYSKMGGLSDLKFSVWKSKNAYVYIARFKRSNDELSMYQSTYYVMNPDRLTQVQATHFGEDAIPSVDEVARHLIDTFSIKSQ